MNKNEASPIGVCDDGLPTKRVADNTSRHFQCRKKSRTGKDFRGMEDEVVHGDYDGTHLPVESGLASPRIHGSFIYNGDKHFPPDQGTFQKAKQPNVQERRDNRRESRPATTGSSTDELLEDNPADKDSMSNLKANADEESVTRANGYLNGSNNNTASSTALVDSSRRGQEDPTCASARATDTDASTADLQHNTENVGSSQNAAHNVGSNFVHSVRQRAEVASIRQPQRHCSFLQQRGRQPHGFTVVYNPVLCQQQRSYHQQLPRRSMQDRIIAAGGHAAAIAAMRRFPDDADIWEKGCAVLGNIATASERNRLAVIAAGGREVMQEALERHPNARRLVIFAQRGLAILSQQRQEFTRSSLQTIEAMLLQLQESDLDADNSGEFEALHRIGIEDLSAYVQIDSCHRKVILAMGGLHHVLVAMQQFPSTPDMQLLGCIILESLTLDRKLNLQSYILRVGGIQAVIYPVLNAMRHFSNHARLQQKACSVLIKLAKMHESNRRDIANVGASVLFSEAMKRHSGDRGMEIIGTMGLQLFATAPTTPSASI